MFSMYYLLVMIMVVELEASLVEAVEEVAG